MHDLVRAQAPVVPGAVVSWEGWSTDEGFYVMQARVKAMSGDFAPLEQHKKYRVSAQGLDEVPLADNGMASLKVAYLERSLTERLESLLKFVTSTPHSRREAHAEKKAV